MTKQTYDIRLLAAASRECIYVKSGQPPTCPKEWPGEPWMWCGACLATAVLSKDANAA